MNRVTTILFLVIFVSGCELHQHQFDPEVEKEKVHQTMKSFFSALENRDWDLLKSVSTDDMILVEHGLLWNNDSLISAMEKYWSGFNVSYSFDFIKTQVDCNTAWMVYKNHGIASTDTLEIRLHWIESLIFTKIEGEWKLAEAQSTRVGEPEYISLLEE